MKQGNLMIRCTYEETSKKVEQILHESFRLFLQRELGVFANGYGRRVQ